MAWHYAAVGDKENTIKWIEKAAEEGEPTLSQIRYMQRYDFVRDDTRFQAVMNQLGF